MVKKGQKKKRVKTSQRKKPARIPRAPPMLMDSSNPTASTSYGAIIGARKFFPLTRGVGKTLVVSNFENVGVSFTGTGGFTVGGSVVNAGITGNFPWLSAIAGNYQKFRWKYLRYIYIPQCPSTTPGSIWLQMYYDPFDSSPSSLAQVTASSESVVGNAWFGGALSPELAFGDNVSARDAICLTVDTSKFTQPWYYVRQSSSDTINTVALTGTATGGNGTLAVASGQTFEYTTRPGTIYYGTNNITNAVAAGDLYVAYICELSDPILTAVQN